MASYEVASRLKVIVHPFCLSFSGPFRSRLLSETQLSEIKPYCLMPVRSKERTKAAKYVAKLSYEHYLKEIKESAREGHAVAIVTVFRGGASSTAPTELKAICAFNRRLQDRLIREARKYLGNRLAVVEHANEFFVPGVDPRFSSAEYAETGFERAGKLVEEKLKAQGVYLHKDARAEVFGEALKWCVPRVARSFKKSLRAFVADEKCPG